MDTDRTAPTADPLFQRSLATLLRSWQYLASGSPGAEVSEPAGAAIATFTRSPEREFLNNSVLVPDAADIGTTIDTIEHTYATHGIERYVVWVHETAPEAATSLRARGYRYDTSTRTMAMPVDELRPVDSSRLELGDADLGEFWRLAEVEGLVADLRPAAAARFYVARQDGENAATLMTFDHDRDGGIYMVGTVPAARRRGLATALSALAVAEAGERGCTTASLQATEMAERVYARVGFRDLGRFEEYVPAR